MHKMNLSKTTPYMKRILTIVQNFDVIEGSCSYTNLSALESKYVLTLLIIESCHV